MSRHYEKWIDKGRRVSGVGVFNNTQDLLAVLKQRNDLAIEIEQAYKSQQISQQQRDDLTLLNRVGSVPAATVTREILTSFMDLPSIVATYGSLVQTDPKLVLERWQADFKGRLTAGPPGVAKDAPGNAPFCMGCGAKMPEAAGFCPKCGTKRAAV